MANYSVENTDAFLKVYRKLETIKTDNGKMYEFYENKNKNLFDTIRSIRNNLTHNEINGTYPVIVSDDILEKLKDIVFQMRIKAIDICIKIKNVFSASLNDKLNKIIEVMSKNNYSYVPIIDDNGKILGVISEQAIFDILFANKGFVFNENTIVSEYLQYFVLKSNNNDSYPFVKKDLFLYEVKDMFDNRYKGLRKIGVLFVTETGAENQKIIGMITAKNVYSKIE